MTSERRRFFVALTPLLFFLAAYSTTMVLGAVYFLTPDGKIRLFAFLGTENSAAKAAIGSFPYLFLTFGPYLITTVFALIGIALFRSIAPRAPLLKPNAPGWALWLVATVAFSYCLFRLGAFDALLPGAGTYQQNILRRVFLFDHLGLAYFVATYAFLPICAAMFMARFATEKRLSDLIGLVAATLCFDYLVLAIYTKSHLLVFAIMLASAVIFARMKLYWIPVIVGLAFVTFIPAEYVLSGLAKAPIAQAELKTEDAKSSSPTMPAAPTWADRVSYMEYFVVQSMSFRMASALPYYVAVFSDPKERCGIEAHTLRKIVHLPDSDCVIPTKIFPLMYPSIKWVEGYSPAAAPISAYGELGLWWSAAVMALSGLALGLLGGFVALGEGPIFVGIGAASCTFAYYLTQLPFIGAFTYPHGLIFLSLPVALLFMLTLILARFKPAPSRRSLQ